LLCPAKELAEAARVNGLKRLSSPILGDGVPDLADRLKVAPTCAVVSGSGVLLKHSYGSEIDGADVVFRFNEAPSGGEFAAVVGTREDIRIVNQKVGKRYLAHLNKTVVHPGTMYLLNKHYSLEQDELSRLRMNYPASFFTLGDEKRTFTFLSKGLLKQALPERTASIDHGLITTGFEGISLALAVCGEVRAYGFPSGPNSESAPFHYHGKWATNGTTANTNPNLLHTTIAAIEKEYFRRLAINTDIETSDVAILPGYANFMC